MGVQWICVLDFQLLRHSFKYYSDFQMKTSAQLACSDTNFAPSIKTLQVLPWQSAGGRFTKEHIAIWVFVVTDATSVLWKPVVRSRVKCLSLFVFRESHFLRRAGLRWLSNTTLHSPSLSQSVSKHRFIFIQPGEIRLFPISPSFLLLDARLPFTVLLWRTVWNCIVLVQHVCKFFHYREPNKNPSTVGRKTKQTNKKTRVRFKPWGTVLQPA